MLVPWYVFSFLQFIELLFAEVEKEYLWRDKHFIKMNFLLSNDERPRRLHARAQGFSVLAVAQEVRRFWCY